MGLLDKVEKFENIKKEGELSRYFLFKSVFESFLKDVGARKGAFLVKQGRFFHLAFPVNVDCEFFRRYSLDASLMSSIENFENTPFLLFNKKIDDSTEVLNTSFLYSFDDLGCVFLLLDFDNRLNILQNDKSFLISRIVDFEKEYKQNEILVNTSIPTFPKYVGVSSIESKMEGAVLASTSPNFLKFSFASMFDFSSLHNDKDNLPLFYSIVNRIGKMIGRSNFAILERDLTLNACIFSSVPLDGVVYTSTLKTVLSSIYGNDIIDKLDIFFVKTLHNKNEKIASWISECYNPLDGYEC